MSSQKNNQENHSDRRKTTQKKIKEGFQISGFEDNGYIEVLGPGTMNTAPILKDISYAMIGEGKDTIFLNMEQCDYMDSTFMGVLAGLSGRLARKGAEFTLVNLDRKNLQLLQTLGIDQVLKYLTVEETEASCVCSTKGGAVDLSEPEEDKLATAETMLKAHQTLAELNDENVDRFKNVISFLEQDVRKLKE